MFKVIDLTKPAGEQVVFLGFSRPEALSVTTTLVRWQFWRNDMLLHEVDPQRDQYPECTMCRARHVPDSRHPCE